MAASVAARSKGCPVRYFGTKTALMAVHAGSAWGHIAPTEPLLTSELLPVGANGARNLKFPVGGWAYLIFKKL